MRCPENAKEGARGITVELNKGSFYVQKALLTCPNVSAPFLPSEHKRIWLKQCILPAILKCSTDIESKVDKMTGSTLAWSRGELPAVWPYLHVI